MLQRTLLAASMLACVLAQPELLATALMLGLHGADHEHSTTLVPEGGHLHLVLSHADHQRDPGHGHAGLLGTEFSETDHVFHIASQEPINASTRRWVPDPGSALSVVATHPAPPVAVPSLLFDPVTRHRSSTPLKPVVLRL